MSYRELLTHVSTGEAATLVSCYAANLARRAEAKLVGVVVEPDFMGLSEFAHSVFDNERRDVAKMLANRKGELREAAHRAGAIFENAARQQGLAVEVLYRSAPQAEVAEIMTNHARLHDCSIFPAVQEARRSQPSIIEAVLLGSGRPIIQLPQNGKLPAPSDTICVAWDGSRSASRAVHDALPLLRTASVVEVVSIVEEKLFDQVRSGLDLIRHLKAHQIEANYREVQFEGKPIGEQLMQTAVSMEAELLVMGAYGHSRIRQIVFGGATRSVLSAPLLPTFMSC